MSGFEQFEIIAKRIRSTIMMAAGGSALVPILADFGGLAPSWPPNTTIVTSVFCMCSILIVFQLLRRKRKALINTVMLVAVTTFFVSFCCYIFWFTRFTFVSPTGDVLFMGCGWTERTKLVVDKYGASVDSSCPGQYNELLEASNFDQFKIWTTSSIDFVQMISFMLWAIAFIGFSTLVAAFVTYQSEVK